jgi:cellulose synthase/poly-beta-1,6-N-acetylglucosamine synthase-like glycosyltransferase
MIIYPYAVYPAALKILGSVFRRDIPRRDGTPVITVIISAFNEEKVIGEKIENTLKLDYPVEHLEIIVVSDNSTDKTNEIVKRYEKQGVLLLAQPVRKGKTAGLNEAVKNARGDILFFTDADSLYKTDALKIAAGVFSGNPKVGLLTGSTDYLAERDGKMVATTGMYTRLERFIKRQESLLGSCVGADGAIFAMRRALYSSLQHDDINDLVLPLNVVRQGWRVVFHENLVCTEAPAADESGEFNRQVRITNRTLRALFRNADLMNILQYPLFSLELISHKLIRLTVPLFMLFLLPLNILLLTKGGIYSFMLLAQMVVYGFCLVRFRKERAGKRSTLLTFLYHFVIINLSMLIGWMKYLSGQKNVTWDPQKQ